MLLDSSLIYKDRLKNMKLVLTGNQIIIPYNKEKLVRIREAKDVFFEISKDFKKFKEIPNKDSSSDKDVTGLICQPYRLVMEKDEFNISNQDIWMLARDLGKFIFSEYDIVNFCRNNKSIFYGDKMSTIFLSRDCNLGKIITVRSSNHALSVYYEELGDIRVVPFVEMQVIVLVDTLKSK
jgi:hypothetical protein